MEERWPLEERIRWSESGLLKSRKQGNRLILNFGEQT